MNSNIIRAILIFTFIICPGIFNASVYALQIAQIPLSACLNDSNYRSFTSLAVDPVVGVIYQAGFRTTEFAEQFATHPDWSGRLSAYEVTNGVLDSNAIWEAGSKLAGNSNRKFYMMHDIRSLCSTFHLPECELATEFIWTIPKPYLNQIQKNYLSTNEDGITNPSIGQNIMDYFRGSNEKEYPNGEFRVRTSLLGDIVNSDPVFVGSEDYGYYNLPTTEGSAYQQFMISKLSDRPRMIYVGSNDGMLHGFEAGSWDTATKTFKAGTGNEVFAYTPGIIVNKNLRLRAYYREGTYNHTYLVDGSARVGDAYYSSNGHTDWHTVLLGTTGASPTSDDPQDNLAQLTFPSGGRGIFALDVTDPSNFNKDYATGKEKLLWEFNNWTPPNPLWQPHGDPDLGMTMAQPSLARMQNGKWAVIAANGYNSFYQKPVLYLLDVSLKPSDPNFIIRKFSPCETGSHCPTGAANGLSTPIAVDVNNDRRVDYIYAGDLTGNLWKFDVNCPSINKNTGDDTSCLPSTSWKVANNGKPLFVACTASGTTCADGNRQPITSKPQVGSVSALQGNAVYSPTRTKPSVMVYFGTGRYLELADRSVGSTQTQTFYALWDKNSGDWTEDNSISDRSRLQPQTIVVTKITQTSTDTTALDSLRVTSNNIPCYVKNNDDCKTDDKLKLGWYMDLTTPNNSPSERVISFPLLLNGNILFTTIIPSPDPCVTDAVGWIMELDAITGSRTTTSPFDIFGSSTSPDGSVNNLDLVYMTQSGKDPLQVAPSGLKSTVGMVKTPAILPKGDVVDKFFGGSTGAIQKVTDPGESLGRVSWRQLR